VRLLEGVHRARRGLGLAFGGGGLGVGGLVGLGLGLGGQGGRREPDSGGEEDREGDSARHQNLVGPGRTFSWSLRRGRSRADSCVGSLS
jgi:hypothetical protein